MSDYTIYALKISEDMQEAMLEGLQHGEGRFGWSYVKTADLRLLKKKVDAGKELTEDEWNCAQWFLLDLKQDDYVVYINTPNYGECTMARVAGPYVWRWEDNDFNHRFPVDPKSVRTFNRNGDEVHPLLKSKLKLRGRYWRIYAQTEFEELLRSKSSGKKTSGSNKSFLAKELLPLLKEITSKIHRTHPSKDLEALCADLFRRLPGVKGVERKGSGKADKGADLLVRFDDGLPIPQLTEEKTLLVQVKSFEGEHWVTGAVDDIRRAFEHYPEAHMGLIISTAEKKTVALEKALESLNKSLKKPVALLIGEDVARLFLQYGLDLLGVASRKEDDE